jgi:sec-independent protein translocase protein TatA
MELLVVLVIALLVFGPKKLPEIGRGVGSAIREFKRHSRDLMSYLEEEPEPRRAYPETMSALRPAETYPTSEADADPDDSAEKTPEYPTEKPAELSAETQEPAEDPAETEEPAPVIPPSPTPSNMHSTT